MKTIGLIGGMSWQSTVPYYQITNQLVAEKLGGYHSARLLLYNVDFAELKANMNSGNWAGNTAILRGAAQSLQAAGADMVLICTNTMHKVAGEVAAGLSIPLLHIADAAAGALQKAGVKKVGLLGTRFVMDEDFYAQRLGAADIEVVLPEAAARPELHRIIFDELCLGKFTEKSKKYYLDVIDALAAQGADGVLLACTEIGLLVKDGEGPLPLYDTTFIHAARAVELALKEG